MRESRLQCTCSQSASSEQYGVLVKGACTDGVSGKRIERIVFKDEQTSVVNNDPAQLV